VSRYITDNRKTRDMNRKAEDVNPLPRANPLVLSLVWLPFVVLPAVAVLSLLTGTPLYKFMRDPAAITGAPPFWGIVSNLGVLVWCASATLCVFSWSLLRHRLPTARFSQFLLGAGLLTTLLLVDDLFLLHEFVFPQYLSVPTDLPALCYGALTLCLGVTFRRCILRTDYSIALLALCFFGGSLTVDIFEPFFEHRLGAWRILVEDGFKFSGILVWCSYLFRCCFVALSETTARISGNTREFTRVKISGGAGYRRRAA